MVTDSQKTTIIDRPKLTFKPEVSEFLREHYEKADVILEYGSGGSTVMASEMENKTIYSVESSKPWVKKMRAWFEEAQPPSMPVLRYANIGKTGKWGSPANPNGFKKYHKYPLAIWDIPDFKHPDVVLVDGRFRVACAVTTMLRATKPVTLLFDDYMGRRGYHTLEKFVERKENVANMARFEIDETPLPRDQLTALISVFSRPF